MNFRFFAQQVHPKLNSKNIEIKNVDGFGGEVLRLCNGKRSASDIISAMRRKYPESDEEIVSSVIINWLCKFQYRGIIEFC